MLCLIKYELKKLVGQRFLPILLILLAVFNVWLTVKSADEKAIADEKLLETVLNDYSENPDAVDAYFDDYIKLYDAVIAYNREHRNDDGFCEVACPDSKYSDSDYSFYNSVWKKLKSYTDDYRTTVKKAIRTAEGHLSEYKYLGYSDDCFEVGYQSGVIKSYSGLLSIEFPLINIVGYDMYFDYGGFGVIAMIALLVGGMCIIIPERGTGMLGILRVSRRGRVQTFAAKIAVCLIYCIFICVTLSATSLAAICFSVGLSGISAPVQMISSFRLCPYIISVGQAVLISLLIRIAAGFAFISVIVAISGFFRSYIAPFIIGLVFVGVNYAAANYDFLNDYNAIKNLNFLWSINGRETINYWRGIKIFGICIPALETICIVYAVLSIICLAAALFLFAYDKRLNTMGNIILKPLAANVISSVQNKLRFDWHRRICRRATLTGFEFQKLMTPLSIAVIIAALIANTYMCSEAFVHEKTAAECAYNDYIDEYGGEWTQEKHSAIKAEQKRVNTIVARYDEINRMFRNGQLTSFEYRDYREEYDTEAVKYYAINALKDKSDELKELSEQGKKAYFVNELGWLCLSNANWSYIYFAVIIAVFANAFALEYKDGFFLLQNATRYGKKHTAVKKLLISCAISAVFVTVCEAAAYLTVMWEYDLNMPSATAVSVSGIHSGGTLAMHFLIVYLRQLVTAVGFTLFVLALSRSTKKPLPTLVCSAAVAYAPTVFGYFGIDIFDGVSLIRLMGRL